MKYSLAILALAGAALANPTPQGVDEDVSPPGSPPSDCASTYAGNFQISVTNTTTNAKRDLSRRQEEDSYDSNLYMTLQDGVITDSQGRTGYIAANRQFQFDNPPQEGAIYTAGWSACANGSLALGGSSIFYQCLSGNFYNLYDQSSGAQCNPIYIVVSSASGDDAAPSGVTSAGAGAASSAAASGAASQASVSTAVSQIGDGQILASTTTVAVSQISDGQILASSTVRPVSQISDGQIQATTSAAVVSQISDGQIQATTARPVSQISDGQIQATTSARVVSQISDGQIQATTSARVVSQISDGQIQATTAQSATGTITRPAVFTGAANAITLGNEIMAAAFGLAAVAML